MSANPSVAYIHGDVAADGTIPSETEKPFHQMRLGDSGRIGLSEFATMVRGEGMDIEEFYDAETALTDDFLSRFDVIVFGLHQKKWSTQEKQNLDRWLHEGGGVLIYSDSAAGGHHGKVGLKNTVGQETVNNLIAPYGLQVTVDNGGGTRSYQTVDSALHPILEGSPVFEGEGVSVVAVDEGTGAIALIPFATENRVAGRKLKVDLRNVTIKKPTLAAIGQVTVGEGEIIVLFDRQPMWNDGPGSSIRKKDNREVLRRIMHSLAGEFRNRSSTHSTGAE